MSSGRDAAQGGNDTTFVTQLQPNDVLMGRGAPITDSIGNRRFLNLVREKCTGYQQAATRKEKDAIARQIVSIIHARNGLFLRKIDSPEEAMQLGVPQDVAAWTAADEKTVLLKIKQALRDRGLEVRDQAESPPQGDHIEATEDVPSSQRNDEELGADEMVAAGLPSSSGAAPQPAEQQGRAKRAKTQSLQDLASRDILSQVPAAGLTMSAPAQAFNANLFQGAAAENMMMRLQLPLRTNFSQASYNPGTGGYYSQLPGTSQLPIGQDWTGSATTAGINLKRAISINLPPAGANANDGNLLGDLTRQTNFASLSQTANRQFNEGEMKLDQKRQTSNEQTLDKETSGEIALLIACEVCETGQGTSRGGVKLDPIEFCLLSVLNSHGLPTWSLTHFQNDEIISTTSSTAGSGGTTPLPLTWIDIGNHLVQEVQSFLSRQTSRLFPHDGPTRRGPAIEGFVSRLISMTLAYSNNPTSLARMAVMLLEKLRRQSHTAPILPLAAASAVGATTASTSGAPEITSFQRSVSLSESSLGTKGFARHAAQQGTTTTAAAARPSEFEFQGFLTSELRRWAISLNVADEVGFPVPFTSNDEFAINFPQYQQIDALSTAAIVDALGCRAILHQTTFLTRLRSLIVTNSSDQVLSILRTSTSSPVTRQWAGITFVESAVLDMSLIKTLLSNGFSGLMKESSSTSSSSNNPNSNTTDDALLRTLLQHTSITKADIEKQVLHLTSLLHGHFQSKKINQVMSQQAAKIVEMMGSSR